MITYHCGDLLASDCDVIAHGCNCFCTWGSGIARQMLVRHPEAFEADLATEVSDVKKMGTFTQAMSDGRRVFNLYTQFKYGITEPHLDYDALQRALVEMRSRLEQDGTLHTCRIGMPKIGCGLAGGDWDRVTEIIEEVFSGVNIHVYTLDGPVRWR